jgi:hypothetical protein
VDLSSKPRSLAGQIIAHRVIALVVPWLVVFKTQERVTDAVRQFTRVRMNVFPCPTFPFQALRPVRLTKI